MSTLEAKLKRGLGEHDQRIDEQGEQVDELWRRVGDVETQASLIERGRC